MNQKFFTCPSTLGPRRESGEGTGRGPQSNVTAECQGITIELLCAGKSEWVHTYIHTHPKHPSAPGQTATGPLQPLNGCALCFLQQEPDAETVRRPKYTLKLAKGCIWPCDAVLIYFKDPTSLFVVTGSTIFIQSTQIKDRTFVCAVRIPEWIRMSLSGSSE